MDDLYALISKKDAALAESHIKVKNLETKLETVQQMNLNAVSFNLCTLKPIAPNKNININDMGITLKLATGKYFMINFLFYEIYYIFFNFSHRHQTIYVQQILQWC